MGRPLKQDLTGLRFGKLVVLERSPSPGRHPLWRCKCDCGNEATILGGGLHRGTTRSCGCLVAETNRRLRLTHGLTHTRIHRIWNAMKQRCGNPNQPHYARYGGRGITVCERWHTFANFLADMGQPPSEDHTIDRIDNDGPYEPGNCRWATMKEQQEHRRPTSSRGEVHHSARFTEDDIRAIRLSRLPMTKLAKAYGVSANAIWAIRHRKTWAHVT